MLKSELNQTWKIDFDKHLEVTPLDVKEIVVRKTGETKFQQSFDIQFYDTGEMEQQIINWLGSWIDRKE